MVELHFHADQFGGVDNNYVYTLYVNGEIILQNDSGSLEGCGGDTCDKDFSVSLPSILDINYNYNPNAYDSFAPPMYAEHPNIDCYNDSNETFVDISSTFYSSNDIEFIKISPAPLYSISLAHETGSKPVAKDPLFI